MAHVRLEAARGILGRRREDARLRSADGADVSTVIFLLFIIAALLLAVFAALIGIDRHLRRLADTAESQYAEQQGMWARELGGR